MAERVPAVSALIPVFNGEATVGAAIESVRNQTLTDFELVVVDDGSTDATRAIVLHHAALDSRVRLVELATNQGIVAALTAGLAVCRARLVARLDADDRASPERLAAQRAMFVADPDLVMCASAYVKVDTAGRETATVSSPWSHDRAMVAMLFGNCIPHSSVMFVAAAAQRVGGYDETWFPVEDYDLWIKLLGVGRYGAIREVGLYCHDNPAGVSATNSDRQVALQRARSEAYVRACVEGVLVRGVADLDSAIAAVVSGSPAAAPNRRDVIRLVAALARSTRSACRTRGIDATGVFPTALGQLNHRLADVARVRRYALMGATAPALVARGLAGRIGRS